MEECSVTETKESKDVQVKNRGDVGHFLGCKGHCVLKILTSSKDHQPAHLQGHFVIFDAAMVRLKGTIVWKNHIYFNTTMLQHTVP